MVPVGSSSVSHARNDQTSYFNLLSMLLCQYTMILFNYFSCLLKIQKGEASGGVLRQGDGGDDSRGEFKHESEWSDATLLSSRHVVYDGGGSLEVDKCEPISLQKESRWEKLAFVAMDEIIIEKLTLFKYVSSHDLR